MDKPFKIIDNSYLECEPDITFIKDEESVLRLLENLFKYRKVLIYQNNLNPTFFDLKSGLAGVVLQKLAQYQMKAAFLIDFSSIKSERFKELINETNNIEEYRFFESKKKALEWLLELSN